MCGIVAAASGSNIVNVLVEGLKKLEYRGCNENHEALRAELSVQGYVFTSDTDTESIAHLIESVQQTEPDLFKAVQQASRRLMGAYAMAVIDQRQPGKVIVAPRVPQFAPEI